MAPLPSAACSGRTPASAAASDAVTLGSPGGLDPVANHDHTAYIDSVREARLAQDENGRILRAYEATLAPYLVGPGGSASAVDVPVRRGP